MLNSFLSSGFQQPVSLGLRPSDQQCTAQENRFPDRFCQQVYWGREAPGLQGDPDCSPKCRACQPTNQSRGKGTSLLEKGAFSESEVAGTPYLRAAGQGRDPEENWQGCWVAFPQVEGEFCPGFCNKNLPAAPPPRGRGALKRAMSEAEVSAPSSLPHWRGRAVPLLLCVSGRSFGGTPRWEVRGVERAPLLAQALTCSAFLWAHPSSACQALPRSQGARPGPGRFGGGRRAGCLGTWVKKRRPSGKEEQDRSQASSQERLHHWGVGSWAAKGPECRQAPCSHVGAPQLLL